MIQNVVNNIVTGAIALLVLAGVIVGVGAFNASQAPTVATATCNLTGNGVRTGCAASWQLTENIGYMTNNFGAQLPTVGTMFGVALILGAIGLIGLGIAYGANRTK